MPLIIMTGIPCSGKTNRTNELKKFFEMEKGRKVTIISEEEMIQKAMFDKNNFYSDSRKEKLIRGDIKSHTQRLLTQNDILIIDGSNYIKGFRYEIYCMSKLYKTPQCTVQCDLPVEHAWLWNENRSMDEQYSREIFDALILRYETPDSKNRWDFPLFIVNPEDELNYDDIYSALYEVKAPKPNMSTQCTPLSSANYLYDIDRITQEIVNEIISAKQIGIDSNIKIPKYNVTVQCSGSVPQLAKLRRQFLTYSKMQQLETEQIPTLFIQYLNKSL
ncbi:PREDICTED: protein KTI12 homolog [Ceratosolen solmsi marchali]|uniref:Protein KTI12 homolog n=1 Tax=Ceratosolen solmsi marchali TaxID=326594 RepID=A0AAJ6YM37_9HYME|nr:PREDICTED: protein KTI12 homolog [Ceratosolen solmsi marchali]